MPCVQIVRAFSTSVNTPSKKLLRVPFDVDEMFVQFFC